MRMPKLINHTKQLQQFFLQLGVSDFDIFVYCSLGINLFMPTMTLIMNLANDLRLPIVHLLFQNANINHNLHAVYF